MQLNIKVIKKWQPHHFYVTPPPPPPPPIISGLSPLSSKIFGTSQVTQFFEGPTPPPPPAFNTGGGRGGGGSNYESKYVTPQK